MNKKKIIILSIIIGLLLLSFCITTFFLIKNIEKDKIQAKIKQEIYLEYGTELKEENLFNEKIEGAFINEDLATIKDVGEYLISIQYNQETFYTKVYIRDTTPPILEVQDLSIFNTEELPKMEQFITNIMDLSEYELSSTPIEKTIGTQEIIITAMDIHGNQTEKIAYLTILEDKEGPIFSGLTDLYIYQYQSVNLRNNVTASDKQDGPVKFQINDSAVNYTKVGTYLIYYTGEDKQGNKTVAERKITVQQKNGTFLIPNYPTINQYPEYPNGCESAALYTLLQYHNINVRVYQIVDRLKKGDGPYWENGILYGGNPEKEFVGDPRDIHGYGVYQKPMIEVANYYKKGIIDYTGHSLKEVLNIVSQNKPVQVWVSINLLDTNVCTSWTYKPTGEIIDWICNLHSVVIIGFNETTIYVSDSHTGGIEAYNRTQFEKMYNLFGKRAIYYE